MVKPSKGMQPEAVDLDEINRKGTRGMGDDDFRNYMAGKIDKQRQQFGLVLPPPPLSEPTQAFGDDGTREEPSPSRKRVRFTDNVIEPKRKVSRKDMRHYASSLIKRLEKKQSRRKRSKAKQRRIAKREDVSSESDHIEQASKPQHDVVGKMNSGKSTKSSTTSHSCLSLPAASWRSPSLKRQRPDLFFHGVVVLVNGYTTPDVQTLTRLLQRHGGDRETYETTRVTHIIAEALSTAKANIYRKQRMPTPICKPSWITDSVTAGRLLPFGDFLIDQVKAEATSSVKDFFAVKDYAVETESELPDEVPDSLGSSVRDEATEKSLQMTPEHGKDNPARNQSVDGMKTTLSWPTPEAETGPQLGWSPAEPMPSSKAPSTVAHPPRPGDSSIGSAHLNGEARTVGNDPNFLENFFNQSRLSFIGSFRQRIRQSPTKQSSRRSSLGQRWVFHVDMDCFFASVVLRNYPQYRNCPVAISHHGRKGPATAIGPPVFFGKGSTSECATCNYEARKKGVKKGMFLGRAKELCPDLIVLQYDFEGYEEVSELVADILIRIASTYDGAVEQVSCDEAYMELYLPGDNNGNMKHRELARTIAENMRDEIFSTTQCTASVGVGPNKLIARLATNTAKPNGCYVVTDSAELLGPLKLRDLPGVGYRKERELADPGGLVNVRDVWELGDQAESELVRLLGPALGKKIWHFCHGKDDRTVMPVQRKTVGAECNYGVRFNGPYGPDDMIKGLAREVEKRMHGLEIQGSQVLVKVKKRKPDALPPPKFLGHGSCFNLSTSARISGNPTRNASIIAKTASLLLAELNIAEDDIRGMGITMKDLVSDDHPVAATCSTAKPLTAWYRDSKTDAVPSNLDCNGNRCADVDNIEVSMDEGNTTEFDLSVPCAQYDTNVLDNLPEDVRNDVEDTIRKGTTGVLLFTSSESCPISVDTTDQMHRLEDFKRSAFDDSSYIRSQVADECVAVDSCVDEDNDFAIPSRSQIAMSQVDALPSPMRNRIRSRIEEQRDGGHSGPSDPMAPNPSTPLPSKRQVVTESRAHFFAQKKQQNIHRMLKLMAVKSGQDDLSGTLGDSVSLTQFETLPLAMQLQVANNDEIPLARASTESGVRHDKLTLDRQGVSSCSTPQWHDNSRKHNKAHDDTVLELDCVAGYRENDGSFYRNNLLPMRLFMDEHPDATGEAVGQVREFLYVCTSELRFPDAVKLLRLVKHRHDAWGSQAYTSLLHLVNTQSEKVLGGPLDTEWAGL